MGCERKVAIFLPDLRGGGGERSMLNLAQGLAEQGHRVDLVVAQCEGAYVTQVPTAVQLIDLGAGRVVNGWRTMRRLPALVRYLQRERPVALLAALSEANLVAVAAWRMAGIPGRVVINEQNTLSISALDSPNRLMRLAPRFARHLYGQADSVVGVSQGVVDDLVDRLNVPATRVRVIHNPGITPVVRAKAQAAVDHPWLAVGEPPVVLGVGRLTKQKDFPTLIQAFAQVQKTHAARLLILGEGPDRPALEAQIRAQGLQEVVALPGFVENPYAYMARAKVFVLSSLWEGLPTVLVEALYCGAGLVATDCPSGPREILGNGQFGYLTPIRDIHAIATAIQKTLDGQGPQPPVESWQPYTLETVVAQYTEVLNLRN
ncbi:MAG: glycosyltransferase [Caldilineaceae bacterium]|nr:glycosyltransferase [Caldilineaceae bacterium]